MKKYLLTISLTFLVGVVTNYAQTVEGKWKTIDENTGKARSIVEIYQKEGKMYGKVVDIMDPNRKKATCTTCTGKEKGKPILGLEIIKGLEKDGDEYVDGTIFDPESGKTYKSKIWLNEDDPDKLNVRGYVMFLYRTQEWIRAN